ncbi:MAG: AMP-binding protein [Planctomycetota bacterium]
MAERTWTPSDAELAESNPARLMRDRGFTTWEALHAWSISDREGYWTEMIERLGIRLRTAPERVLDLADGVTRPRWLPGARMNVADSCFSADPDSDAVVWRDEDGPLRRLSVADLNRLSSRVAAGLTDLGFGPGDGIAVDLPMTMESVAVYLGIVKAGAAVVSIADSFAPEEIATRLRISGAVGIVTGDVIRRGGRDLPLYGKVVAAAAPRAIVIPAGDALIVELRDGDLAWADFLPDRDDFEVVERAPDDIVNVLFSSGTTGDPKAIPWTQTTPIKCAADGHLHQDIRPGHVVAWPTNLGWMMGPWLIFATLINRGTIALYQGLPSGRSFCEFVQDTRVSMLGLVPSLVAGWRAAGATEGLDWSGIHVFSSTGEASRADDMAWLMAQAGGRPVIEYCGGTEIGGGYVTGTVVQPARPGAFSTPAAGLGVVLLDEDGRPADDGEVFLVPPSIGLSTTLLNRDHDEVYHAGAPRGPGGEILRRHGDRMERDADGCWRAMGRTDDTMNLGGIKVSSASIERVLDGAAGVAETAAIAVPGAGGGPERLVVFAVAGEKADLEPEALRAEFQSRIRERLNPLFKVAEVRLIAALPRTASNKVMRRVLRSECS